MPKVMEIVTYDLYDVALYKMLGADVRNMDGSYPLMKFRICISNYRYFIFRVLNYLFYNRYKNARQKVKERIKSVRDQEKDVLTRRKILVEQLTQKLTCDLNKEFSIEKDKIKKVIGKTIVDWSTIK